MKRLILKARLGSFGFVAAMLLGFAVPSPAHHSFGVYDREKEQTISGVVQRFTWANPHAWIYIKIQLEPDAPEVEWAIELGSPNMLARQGWSSKTLQPGDKVELVVRPRRDGAPGGSLVRATLPDGRVMNPGA